MCLMIIYLGVQVTRNDDQSLGGERERESRGCKLQTAQKNGRGLWLEKGGIWNNLIVCALRMLGEGVICLVSLVYFMGQKQTLPGKEGGYHPISRPCRAHHEDGSHRLRGLQCKPRLQVVVGTMWEQEGGALIKRLHRRQSWTEMWSEEKEKQTENTHVDQPLEHSSDLNMCKAPLGWRVGIGEYWALPVPASWVNAVDCPSPKEHSVPVASQRTYVKVEIVQTWSGCLCSTIPKRPLGLRKSQRIVTQVYCSVFFKDMSRGPERCTL